MGHSRIAAVALFSLALSVVQATRAAEPVDEIAVAEGIGHYDAHRYAEALALLKPAAASGSATARYHLGLMHARGEGVPRDFAAAAGWFELAAEAGHGHSQFILGHMYSRGEGVPRDRSKAHMWFSAATAAGWWKAREAREKLVDGGMTPAEIAESGRLYRAWESRRAARAGQ